MGFADDFANDVCGNPPKALNAPACSSRRRVILERDSNMTDGRGGWIVGGELIVADA
jgi:hypothetical protein